MSHLVSVLSENEQDRQPVVLVSERERAQRVDLHGRGERLRHRHHVQEDDYEMINSYQRNKILRQCRLNLTFCE